MAACTSWWVLLETTRAYKSEKLINRFISASKIRSNL
jgi:hypothetical protein